MKREGFETDKVEPRRRRRPVHFPELPEGEEIETRPETGLGDGVDVPSRPSVRQAATLQENGARFRETVTGCEIDIIMRAGDRGAIIAPIDLRGSKQAGHVR